MKETTYDPAKREIQLTAEEGRRFKKLGDFGEALTPNILENNGFTDIVDLNEVIMNFPYADFSAVRDETEYIISVKSRNKYERTGKLNSRYKLGDTDKKLLKIQTETKYAEYRNHEPAWLAISFEEKKFDAYFGLLSNLSNKRGIPMSKAQLSKYETFSIQQVHGFDPNEFMNIYSSK